MYCTVQCSDIFSKRQKMHIILLILCKLFLHIIFAVSNFHFIFAVFIIKLFAVSIKNGKNAYHIINIFAHHPICEAFDGSWKDTLELREVLALPNEAFLEGGELGGFSNALCMGGLVFFIKNFAGASPSIYDVLWCFMMFYDVLWWFMMCYDVLWCFMMFYDVLFGLFTI